MATSEGKRKALIIAISDYTNIPKDKQLPFCKNDGKAMYDTLKKCRYEIPESCVLIGKVDGFTLRKRINEFFIRNAGPTDTLLFYFSGHGFPDGYGTHFLVSSDMDPDVPNESGFAFSELSQIIEKSDAPRKITILDCCYSGAAEAKGIKEDAANLGRETIDRVFEEGDGKCVLASSLSDQESFKMKNEDFSAFTYFVIEGLNSGNGKAVDTLGNVTPDTLATYVYTEMRKIPQIKQKPIRKTSQSGDIILAEYPNLSQQTQVKVADPEAFQKAVEEAAKRGDRKTINPLFPDVHYTLEDKIDGDLRYRIKDRAENLICEVKTTSKPRGWVFQTPEGKILYKMDKTGGKAGRENLLEIKNSNDEILASIISKKAGVMTKQYLLKDKDEKELASATKGFSWGTPVTITNMSGTKVGSITWNMGRPKGPDSNFVIDILSGDFDPVYIFGFKFAIGG